MRNFDDFFPSAHQTQFGKPDDCMHAQDEKLTLLPVLVLGFPPDVLRITAPNVGMKLSYTGYVEKS